MTISASHYSHLFYLSVSLLQSHFPSRTTSHHGFKIFVVIISVHNFNLPQSPQFKFCNERKLEVWLVLWSSWLTSLSFIHETFELTLSPTPSLRAGIRYWITVTLHSFVFTCHYTFNLAIFGYFILWQQAVATVVTDSLWIWYMVLSRCIANMKLDDVDLHITLPPVHIRGIPRHRKGLCVSISITIGTRI